MQNYAEKAYESHQAEFAAQATVGAVLNLRELREKLGWSVAELASRMGGKPGEKSLRRLEDGLAIRASAANAVFNEISKAMSQSPERDDHIISA